MILSNQFNDTVNRIEKSQSNKRAHEKVSNSDFIVSFLVNTEEEALAQEKMI